MGAPEQLVSPLPPEIVGAPSGASEAGGAPASGDRAAPGGPQEEDTCSEDSFMSTDEPLSAEEKLALAVSLKDAGNGLFKEGKYKEALDKYKEGEKRLKKASGSEEIAVYVQLSSNSCMCCLKLELWQQAIEAANNVLLKEPKNVKALYRRAVARGNVGSLQQAKDDLMTVLGIDKANVEARKELQRLKDKIQAAKAEDKKAYSGLFARASGLYEDREAERERKVKEEEQEKAKRRADWQREMEQRKEKGEAEEDFESWLQRTKEAEDREREEKQKQQAKLQTPTGGLKRRNNKKGSPTSSSTSGGSSSSSSSVMEVDEEDAEIIKETKKMGYCYFRRNLTEEEKLLNAQNKPTKIEAGDTSPQAETLSSTKSPSKGAESISQWNARGTTYEEKDVSVWARTRFAERLQEAAATCGSTQTASIDALLAAVVQATKGLGKEGLKEEKALQNALKGCFSTTVETSGVEDVSGDAHLAVLKVKCSSPLSQPGGDTEALFREGLANYESTGTLKLPEVSSADGSGMSWLEGSSLSLATPPSSLMKPMVDEALQKFREAVAEKIQAFLDDCKALP